MGSALRARIPAIEVGPQKLPISRGEGEHEGDTRHPPTQRSSALRARAPAIEVGPPKLLIAAQIGGVEKEGREEGEGREHPHIPAAHTTNDRPRMGKERSTREIAATPPRVEVPL